MRRRGRVKEVGIPMMKTMRLRKAQRKRFLQHQQQAEVQVASRGRSSE